MVVDEHAEIDALIAASSLASEGMAELCARTPDDTVAEIRRRATAPQSAAELGAHMDFYSVAGLDTETNTDAARERELALVEERRRLEIDRRRAELDLEMTRERAELEVAQLRTELETARARAELEILRERSAIGDTHSRQASLRTVITSRPPTLAVVTLMILASVVLAITAGGTWTVSFVAGVHAIVAAIYVIGRVIAEFQLVRRMSHQGSKGAERALQLLLGRRSRSLPADVLESDVAGPLQGAASEHDVRLPVGRPARRTRRHSPG